MCNCAKDSLHREQAMDLRPRDFSEKTIERISKGKHKLLKHLKREHIKAMSGHLGITKEQTIEAIFASLERLGWRYTDLEKHHIFWFSLIKICIEEKDPAKRWEKVKSAICKFLLEWYGSNLIKGAYEIIEDSRNPIDIPTRGISVYKIPQEPFAGMLLRTVILFYVKDIDVPSDIFIDAWKWWNPNFCEWNFRKDGGLCEIRLKDGTVKEKFIPKFKVKDFEDFEELCDPAYLLLGTLKGEIIEADIISFLRERGVPSQNTTKSISLLRKHVKLEEIKKWLKDITSKEFKSEDEVFRELQIGLDLAWFRAFVEKYLPEYQNDKIASVGIDWESYWYLENRLLDLQNLKIELGELFLAGLSKQERIKALEKLVPAVGFDIFNYKCFRSMAKEWESKGNFDKIQSVLKMLKKVYSPSKLKERATQHDYTLLCLKVIKTQLKTNCTLKQACEVVSKDLKKEKPKLSLRSKLNPEFIRRRFYGAIEKENRYDKYNLNSKDDLWHLYFIMLNRHNRLKPDI